MIENKKLKEMNIIKHLYCYVNNLIDISDLVIENIKVDKNHINIVSLTTLNMKHAL